MSEPRVAIPRLQLQNFKSIRACDVRLKSLTILVGPNGAGKSNFLDALRFTADALNTTLDHALRDRGGVNEVRRRSGGHPNHFAIRLDLNLEDGSTGHYAFKVGASSDGGFRVTDEECVVLGDAIAQFRIKKGVAESNLSERLPAVVDDRLYLVSASSIRAFRPVYDELKGMGFYNLSPSSIRDLQQPDPGALLRRDGGNLASVLGQLEAKRPDLLARVTDYLSRLAPGVEGVEQRSLGPMESIEFRQQVEGRKAPWRFPATSMSDGTLRGLGVLVALLQANGRPPTLVGIEEPEVALHPAAVDILIDAVRDASQTTQVIVTSHSPDLLDRSDIDDQELLAVSADRGVTTLGPVTEGVRSALRDRLFSAGELLRMNQLEPSAEARSISAKQLRLFDL